MDVPGLVDDGIDNPPRLIPVSDLTNPLTVNIPWWDGVDLDYRIFLTWDGTEIGGRYIVDDVDPSTIYTLRVPETYLTHGVHTLGYKVIAWPDDREEPGPTRAIEIDTEPPGGAGGALARIQFSEEVEARNAVLPEDLVSNALEASVKGYIGKKTGDRISVYADANLAGTFPVANSDENTSTSVRFPQALLEQFADGQEVAFWYTIRDRAGNQSEESERRSLKIFMYETPSDLLKPVVPAFDDHQVINEADAREGVEVEIPTYTNVKPDDRVKVVWGTQDSGTPLKIDDANADPVATIKLTYSIVQQAGNGNIDVKYELYRQGFKVKTSPSEQVLVDLTLAGGEDPDPTTPEHENLLAPTVTGAVDGTPNVLSPADLLQDAELLVPWLGEDGEEVFKEDDIIELKWGSQPLVQVHVIGELDVTDKTDLELVVPAAVMQAEGSGRPEVQYYVTRALQTVPGESNTAQSRKRVVEVTSGEDLPGGTTPLLPPVFTNLNENGAIGQDQARDAIPVEVALYDNAGPGDTIKILLEADNSVGGTPGNPIDVSTYEAAVEPITLGRPDLDRGTVTFRLPRQVAYAVCRGSLTAYYRATNWAGAKESNPKRVPVAVRNAGDTSCPIPSVA
ncbi:hypothetical protein WK62_22035 [Burkholderia ubonensis]|uniref:hypothetical protein n=1 Tax=Burkholderia ubonensis TaxID=101571 RepID=UPI0007540363|nr:hypothetical protein [Burkholderia ubonensis]KVU19915.1 hypothetical protein WK62_22035 [Burkholderia ubonensis]